MKIELWQRARLIFDEAMELDLAEGQAFLTTACGDDQELRALVERLMTEANDETGQHETSWLDAGVSEKLVRRAIKPPSLAGKKIGDFQLQEMIGSGGMATVFAAEQQHPQRTVAIKVMRWGLVSEPARQRFVYESKILASLSHPGIAQVYATGTHHDEWSGQDLPYFAMEMVTGATLLTDQVEVNNYDLTRTLKLFLEVCQAVHYGHQKGIIHRDLKPQNILVDLAGRPKIIDFGIARATGSGEGERTLQTGVGQILGTLNYMSPEQVNEDEINLDLRCDVYALGVILFELIARRLPFDFGSKPVTAAIQMIQRERVPRPSDLPGGLAAEGRATELDWIIIKAMEKERERRYPSVSEFAADIGRLLAHEPVLARPPSRIYQARKFVRRHRIPVAAGALVILALVLATTMTSISLAKARREMDTRRVVNNFLIEMLSSASPYKNGREAKVIHLLDQAAAGAKDLYADRPELEGVLRSTLGGVYFALGQTGTALEHFKRAHEIDLEYFGPKHERTLTGLHNLASCHNVLGHLKQADELARKALAGRREALPADDPEIARTLLVLAQNCFSQDQLQAAADNFREALEICRRQPTPDPQNLVQVTSSLGLTLIKLGADAEGESLLRSCIAMGTKELSAEHPSVVNAHAHLALLLKKQGKLNEAADLFKTILAVQDRTLGKIHGSTITTLNNLTACQHKLGRSAAAEVSFREVIKRRQEAGIYKHYLTAIAMGNLGVCLESQDKLVAAEKSFTDALALLGECRIPREHWLTAAYQKGLAMVWRKQKKFTAAEGQFKNCIKVFMTAKGDHRERIKQTRQALITLYEEWGKPELAAAIRKEL